MDHLCFICLAFLMLSCMFIAAWERADLLALVGDVFCIFVTFPCGIRRCVQRCERSRALVVLMPGLTHYK